MESIMKIYAFDLEDEFYKPENALKWLNIPYTTITDMDNIPTCPDDIIIASPKQFTKDPFNDEHIQVVEKLSPKFKKVIMFNDDYTGHSKYGESFPYKFNNVYMLGLEKKMNWDITSKHYRKVQKTNWSFNYVHCRTYYDYRYTKDYPSRIKSKENQRRSKAFINLNKYPKAHRIRLMIRLMENNLIDTGHNSFINYPLGTKEINEILNNDRKEQSSGNEDKFKFPKENQESIKKFNNLLPMTLDFTKPGGSGFEFGTLLSGPSSFVDNSYFNIVTESHYREWGNFLSSEKIIKPLISMQPFFVLGQPYTLKYLQDCGFKTFGDIIDESYDNEVDDVKRFNMVTNEIIKLFTENTLDEIHDIYYSVFDKLEHNFNHTEKHCKNELQIIQDIIDDKL